MSQKFLNGILSESDLTLDDGLGASPKLILKNSSDETWEIFNGTHGILNFYENSDLRLSFAQGGNATFAGDILPSTDSTNDIGSNLVRWDRVYADNLYGEVDQLTVNSNDTFQGTYSLLWHAGATVYSSSFMTINGTTDTLSVPNISTTGDIISDKIKGSTYPDHSFLDFDYDQTAASNTTSLVSIGRINYLGDANGNDGATSAGHVFYTGSTDIDTATALLTINNNGNATFAGDVKGVTFNSIENAASGGFPTSKDYLLVGTGDRGGGLIINDISGARHAITAGGYDLTFSKETDNGSGTLGQDIWMRANAPDGAGNVSSLDFFKPTNFSGDVRVNGNLKPNILELFDQNNSTSTADFKIYGWGTELQFTKRNLSTGAHTGTLLALDYTTNAASFLGAISASNFSGSSSGTNTGDQVLPTDFVSAASGGTFGGDLTIEHANTPSIKLKDTTDPDLEVKIRAANNYGYFEVDNTNTSGSSRLQMKIDGVNTATFMPNSFQTNTEIQINDQDTPAILDFKRENTGGAILNGQDIGRIDFVAKDTVDLTSEVNIGRITVEANGDYSSTNKKSRYKFAVNTGTSLETALTINSDKSLTVAGNLTVNGTTTTLSTQTVEVKDNILQLNTTQGSPDTATAATSGISIYRGDGVTQASLIFDDADDRWDLTNHLRIGGQLTVDSHIQTTLLYNSGDLRLLNKAADGWLTFADRNTSASEAVYDLAHVGTISTSGNATFGGDVIGASFAVPSGASTGFLKADGSVDSTTYSGYNFGTLDLQFQGADPGDIVWRDANGTEVHRIWSGSNDYLTYRNDAGTTYELISAGSTSYNNTNWDTAYTHSQAAHAPTNAEQNVQSDWNATSGDAQILNKLNREFVTNEWGDDRFKRTVTGTNTSASSTGDTWVKLSSVDITSAYHKVKIKFTIGSSDDNARGRELIDVLYENGNNTQENHQLRWHAGDSLPSLFKAVKSIRSASSGTSNTYDLYVQIQQDWQDNFTVHAEWWRYGGSIEYPTTEGSSTAPTAGSDDKSLTSRQRWVDADLLDGQNGTYYLDYGNLNNTPTIPTEFNNLYYTETELDAGQLDNRYYTETEVNQNLARLKGWVNAYSNTSPNSVRWNFTEDALQIQSDTDSTIGAAFKATRIVKGQTIRMTVVAKASAAASTGVYFRMYQHNGDMPNGKTHVSNQSSNSAAVVQEDDTGVTSWHENGAITTDWVTYEKEFTAVADGYISLVVLNWTDLGTNSLYIKNPDIQTVEFSDFNSDVTINGITNSGAVTPRTLNFTTNPTNAGISGSNEYLIGEVAFSGTDTSTNAAGKYVRIKGSFVDGNTTVQGSGGEGGKLVFTLLRHDAGAQPRVEYNVLTLEPTSAILAGDVTINSAGTAASPILRLNNSSSSSFNHALEAINDNLTAGETELLLFGKETNSGNSGFIGFNWNADDDNSNYVTIGHWGYNHLVKIFPTGNTTIAGDVDVDGGNLKINPSSSTHNSSIELKGYEPRLKIIKTRGTGGDDIFQINHENDTSAVDFTLAQDGGSAVRTARITDNGRWVIGGHAEVNSSQLSVQGTFGTTGAATFGGAISTPTGSTFAGSIRITETGTAQHILIGNQDSAGVNKPGMIRSANAILEFGYGNSWAGEGGTMSTTLKLDASKNAYFSGNVNPLANGTKDLGSNSLRWNVGYFNSLRITNVVTNKILKFNGTSIDDSIMSDDGTTVQVSGDFDVTGAASFGSFSLGSLAIDGYKMLDMPSSSTERGAWNPIVSAIRASGYALYPDEDFHASSNSISVYNNAGGTGVVHTRETDATTLGQTAPNSSGYVIRITMNGNATSPGYGGFVQSIPSSDNDTFVQIFQAKLPNGYNISDAQNSQGSNATNYWLTSQAGTGKWEWYARVAHNGDGGTFSGGGHVYVLNHAGSSSTFSWYLASCNLIKVTDGNSFNKRQIFSKDLYVDNRIYHNGNTGNYLSFGTDTLTLTATNTTAETLKLNSELKFNRGGADYSNYIRSSNYPSEGYSSSTGKYWLEYGAKGGHHFVLNTDGGTDSAENDFDDFTIWNGAVDGNRLLEVTNAGNTSITGGLNVGGRTEIADLRLRKTGTSDQVTTTDTASAPAGGNELIRFEGNYTDGKYTHELVKIDRGGNLPLYLQESKGTANSFSNLVRFGNHSNSSYEFEVFGEMKATGADFTGNVSVITGSTSGSLEVGRTSQEKITLLTSDVTNSITAFNDSDGNSTHDFILNRSFAGTGSNNFRIQKAGTTQFLLNTNGTILHTHYSGSYASEDTSGFISNAASGRGTMRIRSATNAAAELFFDIDGGIRWDISVRESSESYVMRWYPAASTPSLTGVSAHVMELTQSGTLSVSSTISSGGSNVLTAATTFAGDVTGTAGAMVVGNDTHTHDTRYYTISQIQSYFKRGYVQDVSGSNLAVGWYTIATNTGDRALGQFQIWDTASSDHQSVLFNASHHFGTDSSNDITVTANSRYSGTNFRYIRIKESGTYNGAALQVYVDGSSNNCNAAIVGGNAQESGWVLKAWIADGTDPGDLDSYSGMTERTIVDLDLTINGGMITTGPIFSGGQTTQYKVLTGQGGGAQVIEGTGTAAAPLLTLTNSSSSTFNHSLEAFTANMTAGESNILVVGKAGSAKNSGYIGYYYSSAGSNNNFVSIGQWAQDHLFRVYGDQIVSTVQHSIWADLKIGTASDTNQRVLYLYGYTANKVSTIKTTNGNLHIDSADGHALYLNYYNGASTNINFGNSASGVCGTISSTGLLRVGNDVVAYYSFSDKRLKKDIKTTENNLDKILSLRPVEYKWKEGPREGVKEIGLIAQEVEKVVPEVVRVQSRHDDENYDEGIDYKQVDYEHLVSTLIGAMQEQQDQINDLKKEIQTLKSK